MSISIPLPETWLERVLERRFRTSLQGAFLFLVMAAIFSTAQPTVSSLFLGGICAIFGEALRIMTAGYGYTVGEISRRGPYRFVRHPYYLGTALLVLGFAAAGRNAWVLTLTLTGLGFVLKRAIKIDEGRYERAFGPRYALYKAIIPALIPRFWPGPKDTQDQRQFSLEWAILRGRHRELDAVFGLILGFSMLYMFKEVPHLLFLHAGACVLGVLLVLGRMLYVAFRPPTRMYKVSHSNQGD